MDSKEKPPLLPGGSTRGDLTGQEPGIWRTLSPMQKRVTKQVADGYTTPEMAQKNACSESLAEKRVEAIADKLVDKHGKRPRVKVTQIWYGRKPPE